MKNIFNSIFKVMVVAVGFVAAATATAQESEEPIITFRTDIYNQSGPTRECIVMRLFTMHSPFCALRFKYFSGD